MANYLAEAKEQVDKAVAAYDAGIKREAEIDKLLCDASVTACEALSRFYSDDAHWDKFNQPTEQSVIVALTQIIKSNPCNPPHFNEVCLPITASALRRFGFKPPEDAEKVVCTARESCELLRPEAFNLVALAAAARDAVKKLADATCELARQLRSKEDRWGQRQKLLNRTRSLLKWVGMTLAAAMISHVVDTVDLNRLSDAGKAAVCVVAAQSINDCAKKGNEQEQKDRKQDAEGNEGAPEPI